MNNQGNNHPSFEDKDEELKYWKDLSAQYLEEADRVQKEADEYAADSQQLEKEYEATIEQNEKKIKELILANNRSHNEIDSLRVKMDQSNKTNTTLQSEIDKLTQEKADLTQYVRELEQKNDDLERSRRYIEESIAGIETAFHSAIERNAILESEVDEKEGLKEKLQRLADETRDLKQELLVKERHDGDRPPPPPTVNGFKTPPLSAAILDSNRLRENETQTTPVKSMNGCPPALSASSRVMALNIVSDLIRKVGGLERRLEKNRYEYRDISTNDLRNRRSTKNSPAPSVQMSK